MRGYRTISISIDRRHFMAKNGKRDEQALPSLALVFGYIAVKELQRLEDRVRVLARLGYGNQEIATICDTTPSTVAVRKSQLRSRKFRRSK
jgi:DNA-binding NarL/FixJ family response regulator